MTEREDLLDNVEAVLRYDNEDVWEVLQSVRDYLKAQEPVEPIYDEDNYIRCGQCKHNVVGIIALDTGNIIPIERFCAGCGRAVKW